MESRKRIKFDEKAVIDNFSCLVCNELSKAYTFQCKKGHIMCKECYKNPRLKNKCPGCRCKLPAPSQRIRNLVVQNFLDQVIKVECPYKANGCEYEANRDLEDESHHAKCFYNFEKYGRLVTFCQRLGYTSCNFQLNNGMATAAIEHLQSHHGVLLAQSLAFEMTLEHFKKAISLQSSPNFWNPIIAKLPEGQGHALLVPILNQNEDFSCLSVWLPDPDYYSPSVPQPPIQVEFELRETENSEFCKISFVQDTISIPKVMEVSLENLSRSIRGCFLKDHMRNEERMTILCKLNGNETFSRETDLESFFCKLVFPLHGFGTRITEKALKWLEEEKTKTKVDRDSLWPFLFNLFDKPTKPDGYCYEEIVYLKEKSIPSCSGTGHCCSVNLFKNKGLDMGKGFKLAADRTTLHYVLARDHDPKIALEKVKILVNSGVDFKRLDKSGLSVLHYASFYGNMQAVKYCLEELRLDTNAADIAGQTSLHVAVRNSNEDCALKITQLLLDHGADPQMKTKDGDGVLELANSNCEEKLEEILRLHQAKKSRKQFMCSLLSERF